MKNKLFILLFTFFSIFIFTDRVNALSFNVNGVDYQVSDMSTLRDYSYYTYVKDKTLNNSSINYLGVFKYKNTNDYKVYYSLDSFPYVDDNMNFKFSSRTCFFTVSNLSSISSSECYNSLTGYFYYPNYYTYYSNSDVFTSSSRTNIRYSSNYNFSDIESNYGNVLSYDITYYLNNELYYSTTIEGGSSHILISPPSYNAVTQNWSGWTYDNNIDLTNIIQDINIYGTISDKSNYLITYYLNNEVWRVDSVIEGSSYTLLEYTPLKNYNWSGWTYDNNIDLTNINENVNLYGTSVFVRPGMVYSEEVDSIIHDLSIKILGREVPVEFDFLYTIMDFILLMLLVVCVLSPFIILFKLLGGSF